MIMRAWGERLYQLENSVANHLSRDYDRLVDVSEEDLRYVAYTWDIPISGVSLIESYPIRAWLLFEKYWESDGAQRRSHTDQGIPLRRHSKVV